MCCAFLYALCVCVEEGAFCKCCVCINVPVCVCSGWGWKGCVGWMDGVPYVYADTHICVGILVGEWTHFYLAFGLLLL